MFSVKSLKEKGLHVSKKRKYSFPVIELTLKVNDVSYTKMFILEDGRLYEAKLNIEEEKIDYIKNREIKVDYIKDYEIKNFRELKETFCKSFYLKPDEVVI